MYKDCDFISLVYATSVSMNTYLIGVCYITVPSTPHLYTGWVPFTLRVILVSELFFDICNVSWYCYNFCCKWNVLIFMC